MQLSGSMNMPSKISRQIDHKSLFTTRAISWGSEGPGWHEGTGAAAKSLTIPGYTHHSLTCALTHPICTAGSALEGILLHLA